MKSKIVYGLCWRQASACARAHPDSEYVEGAARISGRVLEAEPGDANAILHVTC
jgi:hypothetical protein